MNRTLNGLLFLALSAAQAAQADAQLVTYHFTGTKDSNNTTPGAGNTIDVSITLDAGAAPDFLIDYSWLGCGHGAVWLDGNFSIDGVTDTGLAGGTDFGWKTTFQVDDIPCFPAIYTTMQSYVVSGSRF